jgi:hypothetical protein
MTPPSLEVRLAELERSVRRTRLLCLALVLAAVVATAAPMSPSTPEVSEVLRARAFEVVDAGGRVVASLDATPGGGRARVLSTTGTSGVDTLVTEAGGRVVVFSEAGRFRVALGNDQFGGALTIANADGSLVCMARVDEKGEGALTASGRQGAARVLTPHGVRQPKKEREED